MGEISLIGPPLGFAATQGVHEGPFSYVFPSAFEGTIDDLMQGKHLLNTPLTVTGHIGPIPEDAIPIESAWVHLHVGVDGMPRPFLSVAYPFDEAHGFYEDLLNRHRSVRRIAATNIFEYCIEQSPDLLSRLPFSDVGGSVVISFYAGLEIRTCAGNRVLDASMSSPAMILLTRQGRSLRREYSR